MLSRHLYVGCSLFTNTETPPACGLLAQNHGARILNWRMLSHTVSSLCRERSGVAQEPRSPAHSIRAPALGSWDRRQESFSGMSLLWKVKHSPILN